MSDKKLGRHVFVFNPKDNGGESLCLVTDYFDNGDDGDKFIYTNQELTLQSYCNSATFELVGCQITPEALRKLANELDEARIKAKAERAKSQ